MSGRIVCDYRRARVCQVSGRHPAQRMWTSSVSLCSPVGHPQAVQSHLTYNISRSSSTFLLLVHLICCLPLPAGEQIFAYIETLDPTTICTNFGACLPSQLYSSNMTVPSLPLALVAKAAALRMRAHELSATNDFCDTCKMVITEAAAILGNLVSPPLLL